MLPILYKLRDKPSQQRVKTRQTENLQHLGERRNEENKSVGSSLPDIESKVDGCWCNRREGGQEQAHDATLWDAANGLTEPELVSAMVWSQFFLSGRAPKLRPCSQTIGRTATNPARFSDASFISTAKGLRFGRTFVNCFLRLLLAE